MFVPIIAKGKILEKIEGKKDKEWVVTYGSFSDVKKQMRALNKVKAPEGYIICPEFRIDLGLDPSRIDDLDYVRKHLDLFVTVFGESKHPSLTDKPHILTVRDRCQSGWKKGPLVGIRDMNEVKFDFYRKLQGDNVFFDVEYEIVKSNINLNDEYMEATEGGRRAITDHHFDIIPFAQMKKRAMKMAEFGKNNDYGIGKIAAWCNTAKDVANLLSLHSIFADAGMETELVPMGITEAVTAGRFFTYNRGMASFFMLDGGEGSAKGQPGIIYGAKVLSNDKVVPFIYENKPTEKNITSLVEILKKAA